MTNLDIWDRNELLIMANNFKLVFSHVMSLGLVRFPNFSAFFEIVFSDPGFSFPGPIGNQDVSARTIATMVDNNHSENYPLRQLLPERLSRDISIPLENRILNPQKTSLGNIVKLTGNSCPGATVLIVCCPGVIFTGYSCHWIIFHMHYHMN